MVDMFDFGDGPVPAHRHPNGGGWVADTAIVNPTAYVGLDARVFENAQVFGNARVFESAQVFGDARVRDSAWVCGDALMLGAARARGDAFVCGGKWLRSPLYIQGSRHSVTMSAPGMLTIGCQSHSIEHWIVHGKEIGKGHKYTEAELAEYERYIRLAAEMYPEDGDE